MLAPSSLSTAAMAPPWTPFEGLAFGMTGLAASRDAGEKSIVALGKDLKAGLMVNYQRGEAVAKADYGLTWEAARLKSLPKNFKELGQRRIELLSDRTAWIKFKSMETQGRQFTGFYAQWCIKSGDKPPSGTGVDECKEHVLEEAWKAECEEKAKAARRNANRKAAKEADANGESMHIDDEDEEEDGDTGGDKSEVQGDKDKEDEVQDDGGEDEEGGLFGLGRVWSRKKDPEGKSRMSTGSGWLPSEIAEAVSSAAAAAVDALSSPLRKTYTPAGSSSSVNAQEDQEEAAAQPSGGTDGEADESAEAAKGEAG